MPVKKIGPNKYRVNVGSRKTRKDWIVEGTREEANAFEAKKKLERQAAKAARGDSDSNRPRVAPTFFELCAGSYRIHAEANLRKSTWRIRQYQLAQLREVIGDKPIDRIGQADVDLYVATRKKAGVKSVKLNDDIKALTAVLNFAHSTIGFPLAPPAFKRQKVVRTKGRCKVYTEAEVQTLYAGLTRESPHLLGPTVAMINAGLRKGEALAMEWEWVDLERGMLFVQPNEFWQPKDGEPREIPIGRALRPWLEGPRQHPVYVFPTLATPKKPQGDRYTVWPQKQWDAARRAAGVKGSPHVCRHTFASHFLASEPDLWLLAKVLGHSHAAVTELYTHLLPGHLEKARDVVNIGVSLKSLNSSRKRRAAGR